MSATPHVRTTDYVFLDALFEMDGGYVLNFTNQSFSQFFTELGINIGHSRFCVNGTSKAKRLRSFFSSADPDSAVRVLNALWEHREAVRKQAGRLEEMQNARTDLLALIARIQGKPAARESERQERPKVADPTTIARLRSDLIALSRLTPQPRGYAFESFLKVLFDAYGLQARQAFRLQGEQIDGSFHLLNDTYLLEAKWQNLPCGVEDLHAFHGKLEQRASWARGLFMSNSGFSEDGLQAFGRGKRVICMDGLDLYEVLDRGMALDEVLAAKARRAVETGHPFARVRDLLPR